MFLFRHRMFEPTVLLHKLMMFIIIIDHGLLQNSPSCQTGEMFNRRVACHETIGRA